MYMCPLATSSPGWTPVWINQWIQAASMKSSSTFRHLYQVRYQTLILVVNLRDSLPQSARMSGDQTSSSSLMMFHFLCVSAKHYDADTTEPISCGLQTLEELLSWKRSEANPFNVAAAPLAPREPPLASCSRRTLVSHDMMGGYLDDRCGLHF